MSLYTVLEVLVCLSMVRVISDLTRHLQIDDITTHAPD